MIVVDANIFAYWLIEGDQTPATQEVRRRDPHWLTPSLCQSEFLNILINYHRRKGLTEDQVKQVWRVGLPYLVEAEHRVDFSLVLNVALRYKLSGYDAQYVALATALNIPLVTQDQKICSVIPRIAISFKEFLK